MHDDVIVIVVCVKHVFLVIFSDYTGSEQVQRSDLCLQGIYMFLNER